MKTSLRELIIAKTAEKDMENILSYLTENWPEKVRKQFYVKLDKTFHIICLSPLSFPESNRIGVHRAVLTKHNLIYYRFNKKSVEIIRIVDTRIHPARRPE